MAIYYILPKWHKVSFSIIAEKHLEWLKRWMRIYDIDELAFPNIYPVTKPLIILHPYFYVMLRASRVVARRLHEYRGLIGIDVADSDHISPLAVSMSDYAKCMVVPSSYAREAYVRSGVRVRVEVIPHGVDEEYFTKPPQAHAYYRDLLAHKAQRKLKYILFYLWHSGERKGVPELIEWYRRLYRERKDVALILKTVIPDPVEKRMLEGTNLIHIHGWLTENQKMALYDLCDLYPLFSRGGGFELNGLEALSRGMVVIAGERGSWTEYMPKWGLVKSHPAGKVFPDNPIHDGVGYKVDVERALDKAHIILDNLDDYKARVREHVNENIKPFFTWRVIAEKLFNVIKRCYEGGASYT